MHLKHLFLVMLFSSPSMEESGHWKGLGAGRQPENWRDEDWDNVVPRTGKKPEIGIAACGHQQYRRLWIARQCPAHSQPEKTHHWSKISSISCVSLAHPHPFRCWKCQATSIQRLMQRQQTFSKTTKHWRAYILYDFPFFLQQHVHFSVGKSPLARLMWILLEILSTSFQ